MSKTLAFLIDAPLQSWGASSKFQRRDTENWPTKSALIGLLAAALGIDKNAADEADRLAPLCGLVFTVLRWPKAAPSVRLTDFHTVGGGYDKKDPVEKLFISRKAGDGSPFGTVITRRTYLMDTRFIAIFQGDGETLDNVAKALLDPVWGLWFGRKACMPAEPLSPVVALSAVEALTTMADRLGVDPAALLTLEGMTEKAGKGTFHQADQPTAFGQHHGPIPTAYLSRSVRRLEPGEIL
jgi:CRISPR-associated protein Cas5/CasD subtype I-E